MALSTETIATAGRKPLPGGIREISDLAYPVVLTQISHTLMGVVDSAMVGRLGATELAAVGFAGVWIFTLYSLLDGTASGVQTFVSQADGGDDQRSCGAWVWQGLYALLPAAILMTLGVAIFVRPALALLGPSDDLQTAAASYLLARVPGEVGFVIVMVFTSFFRGIGDTKTPLYVTLGANIINLVLDYGLIFGNLGLPAWGVAGAGIATSIAEWANFLLLGIFFYRFAGAEQYQGWPRTISQFDNRGEHAWQLPELVVRGGTDAVLQVTDAGSGDVVYTVRINGDRFHPPVPRAGDYDVAVTAGASTASATDISSVGLGTAAAPIELTLR